MDKRFIAVLVINALLSIAFIGAIGYVVVHFVSKFW